jgi:hypothetical protein
MSDRICIFGEKKSDEEFAGRFHDLVAASPFDGVIIERSSGYQSEEKPGAYFRLRLLGHRLKMNVVVFVDGERLTVEGVLKVIRKQLMLWGSMEARKKIYLKAC